MKLFQCHRSIRSFTTAWRNVPLALRYRTLTLISGLSHWALSARLSPFNAGFSSETLPNFSTHSALACDGGLRIAGPANSSFPSRSRASNPQAMPLSSVLGAQKDEFPFDAQTAIALSQPIQAEF